MMMVETTWEPLVGMMRVCVGLAAGRRARVVDRSPVVRVGRRGRLVG